MPFPAVIADMLLDMPRIRSTFVNWIAAECKRLSQKRNKLATHEAFQLSLLVSVVCSRSHFITDIVHSVAFLILGESVVLLHTTATSDVMLRQSEVISSSQ